MEGGLNKILDDSGPILKRNLAQVTKAVAIDNLADIVSGLGNVKRHLKDIQEQTIAVQTNVNQLRIGLNETKVKLISALNQCRTNDACSTFMQEYNIHEDLAVASDFEKLPVALPDVSLLLRDIADLMNNDIEKKVIYCVEIWQTQCGNFRIFLPLIFCVKFILANFESRKLAILTVLEVQNFNHEKVQKFQKI